MNPLILANGSFQFLDSEVDNEITLTAFRLLVMDLLVFFHVVNEGVINVLGISPQIPVRAYANEVRTLF